MRSAPSILTLALVTGGLTFTGAATAQPVIEIDAEDRPAMDGPVVAGAPTDQAAAALRLLRDERWADAALALHAVVAGETGDDAGNVQLAQYHLAIALYNLAYYVPAYGLFAEIASNKDHAKFAETLPWLARLSQKLPESADVVELIGRYDGGAIVAFDDAEQRPLRWQLSWMLGRYKYGVRDFDAAISYFEAVDAKSAYFALAKFFQGLAYVQTRHAKPALDAFEAVRASVAAGTVPQEQGSTLLDLANLNIARTHYTVAFRQRREGDFEVSATHMDAALAHWDAIPMSSPFAGEAFYERSRAHFALGDYGAALGDLESARSPLVAHAGLVQADTFEVEIYGSLCDQPAVATLRSNLQKNVEPVRDGLRAYLARRSTEYPEEELFRDLRVLVGRGPLTGTSKAVRALTPEVSAELARVLGKRDLARELDYVDLIESERSRLGREPSALRDSDLGLRMADDLELARELAVRRTGGLAGKRIRERLDELDEELSYADTIVFHTPAPVSDPALYSVDRSSVTDDSGLYERWPVDGEVWADEVGTYRAVVVSKCPAR